MYCMPDNDIENLIEEDVPYGDLTTSLLGIGGMKGEIAFRTRKDTRICCTEEAARVLEKCGAEVSRCESGGTDVPAETVFLIAKGPAEALHRGWKVALNILEYASGIATRTKQIVENARAENPGIYVLTTRKSFPGTKKISVKAILAGGALPHRLGLSETILVFKQHTVFVGGLEAFLKNMDTMTANAPEKKIIVEVDNAEEALMAACSKADIIQIDKMSPAGLAALIKEIRKISQDKKISAAGGINESNAGLYAATGVDMLVLSSVYFGKPADISVSILPVN
jgi:molybdenum transport protein